MWLLAGALAARQTAAVLRLPPDERLTDLLAWIGDNGVLRARDPLYDGPSPFTGTPFAGLVLKPLTRAAEQGLGVAWTFGTLLLVAAVGVVAVRALPGPMPRRAGLFAVPAAIGLLMVSAPVRDTFHLGQTSILPVLLVLVGWLAGERERPWPGVLFGIAAALQPAVLLFLPLLWATGRRRDAGGAALVFGAATAAAWAVMPGDSWTYWVHHVAGAGLGDAADAVSNQSLHGALLRLGLQGPLEIGLLAVLVPAVCWIALRRAVRYARDGQPLLAAAVTGCAAVAASPTAWQHQQLWVLLAVSGRVGRRRADRLVWPVFVVLVMSLKGEALVPHLPVLSGLSDNAPLVAGLLAACVLPFLLRGAAAWDSPERSGPLSRPHLMLELLLIRAGYWAYSYVRGQAPDARGTAELHGHQVLGVERVLGLDVERAVNGFAVRTPWLETFCDFYYSTFHFLVPLALLGWLYWRRPDRYRLARTALALGTLSALVGFWLYPLAPPRLMPGMGYVDTAHGPQVLSPAAPGALSELVNQYAAMPSLHVGWAVWCGVVLWRSARSPWLRALGVLHPLLTLLVVLATANHYVLDAVGGVVVVAAGFAMASAFARVRTSRAIWSFAY
ncbi:bifunctional glycosyltransferase 87/phosphatase PAP2 family protein [Streptomyces sp. ODS28]|uniref:bifunctional glycosyltransferase 87/phosphatase PAP2 family protein n=1 Tax=Streptomyces sp. ODS28 TaxID=3136688 RepID=UPI0031EBD1A8